jgi:Undecaprenyl-phosphate galactose phosphotransferase WbaP
MKGGRRRVYILALTDFVLFYAILLFVALAYQQFGGKYSMNLYLGLWPFALSLVGCNALIRLYHGNFFYPGAALSVVEELRRSFFSISLACLLLLSYLSLTRGIEQYSRVVIAISYLLALILLPIGRWMVKSWMKKSKKFQIKALIAGAGKCGKKVYTELQKDRQLGLAPMGFLDDNLIELKKSNPHLPIMGTLDDATKIATENEVEYLILCLPLEVVKNKMQLFTLHFKHILIVPDNTVSYAGCIYPCDINGLAAIELKNQLLLQGPRLFKGILELCMAVGAFLLLWPLFLLLAILIKLTSRGPIFYYANRLGIGGKPIKVLKFRTMYLDAHDRLEQILAEDPVKEKEWRDKFKLADDPRITPLGRLLRRTSLDELPQFWNVLTGQMSVIGPRPIVESEITLYGKDYELVSRVKPGITGLWQVSGRSYTSYDTRIFLDMYYIMNWSPWLDYYIFLKTVKEVISCHGAQ